MILAASDFLVANWLIMLAVTVAGVIVVSTFFRTEYGKYNLDKFKTRIPVISKLTNKVYAARFTRSLSSLVSAGVNMPEALEISSRTVLNTYLGGALDNVVNEVKQGTQLSDSLMRMNEFPQLVSSVAKIGEESGELETMLMQLADYYDDEADVAITSMMTAMEPALILLMAGIVVPILFGVLQPMFGMMELVADM
jgi:type II secretory pathway component PulF